jgi:hypothetical protein
MKNENKAAGGKARAEKLSSERRKEIALKAAAKRWEGHQKKEREPPKKIRGISKKKNLVAIIKVSLRNMNMGEIEIIEKGKVIRKFSEQPLEKAHATIDGYVSALKDLGIIVEIQINKVAKMEL